MKSPVVDEAVGEGAVDRRAHRREVEIALGLGERGLQFRKLGVGLGLLRPGHFDIVARGVIGRLRGLHGRHALVARRLRTARRWRARQIPWCSSACWRS